MTRNQIWTIIILIAVIAAALVSASTSNNESNELISVDEDLRNIIKTNVPNIIVPVVVVLREQPANDISNK